MSSIVGVKLREWERVQQCNAQEIELKEKDLIILETDDGLGSGTVKILHRQETSEDVKKGLKKIIRKANDEDLMQLERNHEKENTAFSYCQGKIKVFRLNMKLVSTEYLFDGSKAIFYFTAEERVDFRALVKELAAHFHIRIELKQIGVRDEAKIKGGIGPCGRLLCCSEWINSFEPVSVKMAKVQNLSLNPTNISGMCGRLMCCLSFEYQNYVSGEMSRQKEVKEPAKVEIVRGKSPPPERRRPRAKPAVPEEKKEEIAKNDKPDEKQRPPKKGKRNWKKFRQKKRKQGEQKKES